MKGEDKESPSLLWLLLTTYMHSPLTENEVAALSAALELTRYDPLTPLQTSLLKGFVGQEKQSIKSLFKSAELSIFSLPEKRKVAEEPTELQSSLLEGFAGF